MTKGSSEFTLDIMCSDCRSREVGTNNEQWFRGWRRPFRAAAADGNGTTKLATFCVKQNTTMSITAVEYMIRGVYGDIAWIVSTQGGRSSKRIETCHEAVIKIVLGSLRHVTTNVTPRVKKHASQAFSPSNALVLCHTLHSICGNDVLALPFPL
jgi:hypothetical protein